MTIDRNCGPTVIELAEGPKKIADEIAEKLILPALNALQGQYGNSFSVQVYQDLLARLITTRVECVGYDAVHEVSGVLEEIEADFFPEQEEPEPILQVLGLVNTSIPSVSSDFLLVEGQPS